MDRKHTHHRMRQTSIESYRGEMPSLGEKQSIVLDAIRHLNENGGSPTDREIAMHLGCKDPNVVRPRRNELMEYGIIIENGKKVCSVSGRTAIRWGLTTPRGEGK